MMYISIGHACDIKHQIDKHKHKMETLFFDWLMTSMKSVIEVLSCDNIDTILNTNTIVRDKQDPYHKGKSRINITSLDSCISIHDIGMTYSKNDILQFIGKYKRRFTRIIEIIKSKEKIVFMRKGSVDDCMKQQFIETILKINPECRFTLVVIDNNTQNTVGLVKSDHCLHIKLNIDKPKNDTSWTASYLNFKQIFLDIENNT